MWFVQHTLGLDNKEVTVHCGTWQTESALERRLEALSEQRQSKLQRVKAAQKERDGLAGDKEAAEIYLTKELECLSQQSTLAQVLVSQAKVRGRPTV